ncbi:uncharacterized protein LOC113596692 [Acinonyx jubatus]|uniref:Uncharacterized protein LOC113596692 n=1 Tax=Acinonyx jubatus TaxID=32536 RepID=A0A6J1YQ59_ACIJB|nr:uncharacterized protein LOC113596692 [Acinonyx jubatus]
MAPKASSDTQAVRRGSEDEVVDVSTPHRRRRPAHTQPQRSRRPRRANAAVGPERSASAPPRISRTTFCRLLQRHDTRCGPPGPWFPSKDRRTGEERRPPPRASPRLSGQRMETTVAAEGPQASIPGTRCHESCRDVPRRAVASAGFSLKAQSLDPERGSWRSHSPEQAQDDVGGGAGPERDTSGGSVWQSADPRCLWFGERYRRS